MKNTNATETLNEAIALLQAKQKHELILLKDQFEVTYDSLKPMNLFRNAFGDFSSSPDVRGSLINKAIAFSTGFITNKFFGGASKSPFSGLIGTALKFLITKVLFKRLANFKF